MRDSFSKTTVECIAKRANYLCSLPQCRRRTLGPKKCGNGIVNIGVAAHITAASPRGPRYDPSLSKEERKSQSNGIWCCQNHVKLVDDDKVKFTVEILKKYKADIENQCRDEIESCGIQIEHVEYEDKSSDYLEHIKKLNLPDETEFDSIFQELLNMSSEDLETFKRMPGWPSYPIDLNLRIHEDEKVRNFKTKELAEFINIFGDLVIIAQPGIGKTTTLIQVTEEILEQKNLIASFILLNEWSSESISFFQSITNRGAFINAKEEHLMLLAKFGRLILILDGWNELDNESRKRTRDHINKLKREYPDIYFVISSRRQVIDVPVSGQLVEIDTLSYDQQLEIARKLRGTEGEIILDHAWRKTGIRELVSIPLYLNTLLSYTKVEALPKTKEEVLRIFVEQHERELDKKDILRNTLHGFHKNFLSMLAINATQAANTNIEDKKAHEVISQVSSYLNDEGQLVIDLQPPQVLDLLVNHHMLIRSKQQSGGVAFQHQQFQEWFASFEIEELMIAAISGDLNKVNKLKKDILNIHSWEESILFACERLSRKDNLGVKAVAETIVMTLGIDPMLSSEMIYRSSPEMWDEIKEEVIKFAREWHEDGKIDRAFSFMINTGCSDFAPIVWSLISDPNDQIHLHALRAGRQFRSSVLGKDYQEKIKMLPVETRAHIIAEIASQGGMDEIEYAVDICRSDENTKVKLSLIESLYFRRADRHVIQILKESDDELWKSLAKENYPIRVSDKDITARLNKERNVYVENETDIYKKISFKFQNGIRDGNLGREITTYIESKEFPVKEQHIHWFIDQLNNYYSNEIASAFLHRLEAGLEIPYRAESYMRSAGIICDDGTIVENVLNPETPERIRNSSASIIGTKTIEKLLDEYLEIEKKLLPYRKGINQEEKKTYDQLRSEHDRLYEILLNTAYPQFIQALIKKQKIKDPSKISSLADLLFRHSRDDKEDLMQLNIKLKKQLIEIITNWSKTILKSDKTNRYQLSNLAYAIEKIGEAQLVDVLHKLLIKDLKQWNIEREEFSTNKNQEPGSARMSYTNSYQNAFIAIGTSEVVEIMKDYLPDKDFGVEAALVLKKIWEKENKNQNQDENHVWQSTEFAEVLTKKLKRQNGEILSTEFAEEIFRVVQDLIEKNDDQACLMQAIKLATVGFRLPYGNNEECIRSLISLPVSIRKKQNLIATLIFAGENVESELIIEGIKTTLHDAEKETWLLDNDHYELQSWLELMPFTNSPLKTLEVLELIEHKVKAPLKLSRLLSALQYANLTEVKDVIDELIRKYGKNIRDYEIFNLFEKISDETSFNLLIGLISDGFFPLSDWHMSNRISNILAKNMETNNDFRTMIYSIYENNPSDQLKKVLENTISKAADTDGVLLLVRKYSELGKSFDGILYDALNHVSTNELPSDQIPGAFQVFSAPITKLRKELFDLIGNNNTEANLAIKCLNVIDQLRDEYGIIESEPRHPDIDSGRPWPLIA